MYPVYFYLNEGIPSSDYTDWQRNVLEADAETLRKMYRTHVNPDAPTTSIHLEDILASMEKLGYHATLIKTALEPGNRNWVGVGFTIHGISGWNGKPDHYVGEQDLINAAFRAAILTVLTQEHEEPDEDGEDASEDTSRRKTE